MTRRWKAGLRCSEVQQSIPQSWPARLARASYFAVQAHGQSRGTRAGRKISLPPPQLAHMELNLGSAGQDVALGSAS